MRAIYSKASNNESKTELGFSLLSSSSLCNDHSK